MEWYSTEKERLIIPPPLVALNVWVVRLWAVRIDTEHQRRWLAREPLGDGFQGTWLDLTPARARRSMKRTNCHDTTVCLYCDDKGAFGEDQLWNKRTGNNAGTKGAENRASQSSGATFAFTRR